MQGEGNCDNWYKSGVLVTGTGVLVVLAYTLPLKTSHLFVVAMLVVRCAHFQAMHCC